MNLSQVKAAVTRCRDTKMLAAIERHVRERIKAVERENFAHRCDEAWDRAKHWLIGATIYCAAQGTFLGGNWQRGDFGALIAIQPRAKRIWIKRDGRDYWFEPQGLVRYNLSTEPPADPIDPINRAMADKLGTALTGDHRS